MKINITKEEKIGLKNTFVNFKRKKDNREIFYDLCFCICAPQTKFATNHKVINELIKWQFYEKELDDFIKLEEPNAFTVLREIIKPVRFKNNKAKYLLEMKKKFKDILINIYQFFKQTDGDCIYLRESLMHDIKGLGYKTASHFLRNLGDDKLAIIDTHIIKFLAKVHAEEGHYNSSEFKNIYSKNKYLEFEHEFQMIAKENNLSTAELDALIWQRYSKTKWEDFKY